MSERRGARSQGRPAAHVGVRELRQLDQPAHDRQVGVGAVDVELADGDLAVFLQARLDIADHRRAIMEAALGIGRDIGVVGDAVETVMPALGVKPQQMLAEPRQVRGPELPDDPGPAPIFG